MDNNNLIAAVILSILILVGFQYLYVKPQQEHFRQTVLADKLAKSGQPTLLDAPKALRDRAEVLKDQPRVLIDTPEMTGSINLVGARFDDLRLVTYHQTVDDESPVTLLSPSGSAQPFPAYYAELSWLGETGVSVPTAQTQWKTDEHAPLTPQHPLKLTWDNGQGLHFERTIAVDSDYMFTVTDRVENKTAQPATLYPFGLLARQGNPLTRVTRTSYEGPLGVLSGTLEEFDYKKLKEDGKRAMESQGGWLGITDKYWLAALVVPSDDKITAEFSYNNPGADVDPNLGYYQTDFRSAALTIPPKDSVSHTTQFFAGAKRLRLLDHYADQGIPHFDRAIDFGWFYFLTKPFLYLLAFLGKLLGGVGPAILLFTVGLKVLTLPLSLKSYHSMSRMKALQPEMKKLQERFADDKMRQQQETMELYKREKVNPMSGCLPTLIQIPIFFALYKILYVGIELRQAPFYGWIHDMSVPDPTTVFNAFGLIPINLPAALHIGVWPLLMGCSMFLQQRLSPQPPDKTQARMFMFMPLMFTYMLSQMPAGLVIYWTWSNLLSILQQWFIMGRDAKKKVT